jgi:uncharacterized cysteine cluster protein YcgN (CxxCxxCC family)
LPMMKNVKKDKLRPRFWNRKLDQLNPAEWEALCDGCGRCCLLKIEDDDGDISFTNVACRLLDSATARCGNYPLRKSMVAGCVVLTPKNIAEIAHWMPETCAYRLRYFGKPLKSWHPLISGDPASTQSAGISVAGKTTPEFEIEEDELEDFIIEGWP